MAYVTRNSPEIKGILDALGLKYVRRLDLHFGVNSIATAEVEFYLEVEGATQFPPVLKKFKLIPIEEDKVG